jgi:hypothetical protein
MSQSHITDVALFFSELTDAYRELEEQVHQLTASLKQAQPEEIAEACRIVESKKSGLAEKDEKIFQILELAGAEIVSNPMVEDYRVALLRTSEACNILQQRLQMVRQKLCKDTSKAIDCYSQLHN